MFESRKREHYIRVRGSFTYRQPPEKLTYPDYAKKFLLMSTTATISKPEPGFQEVDSTLRLPLTFIKDWAFPVPNIVGSICINWQSQVNVFKIKNCAVPTWSHWAAYTIYEEANDKTSKNIYKFSYLSFLVFAVNKNCNCISTSTLFILQLNQLWKATKILNYLKYVHVILYTITI